MKTIMLTLNQLGIGGIETAVVNQSIQLIKRNYRVIILAKDGIYREMLEKEGAIIVQMNFVVQNQYDIEKISDISKIMKQYEVEQVHIHQFDCINTVVPACLLNKIPYVAYTHTGVSGTYDWFEKCYKGYNIMFKLYFEGAEKIVAITEQAKQESMSKYNIPEDKYIVIKNSIDFEEFNVASNNKVEKIERFLIVSRLVEEKLESIKNSILFFKEYKKDNSNAKLTIVGDGECKAEIEKEIEDIKNDVNMIGQRNDIAQIISKNDVVIGVDRCILEAITMKKIALISGYDGIKGIITPRIIGQLSDTNFSGRGFENKTTEEAVKEMKFLDKDKIRDIVEENYKYAYENLNCSKNIYLIQNAKEEKSFIDTKEAINAIIQLQNMYEANEQYTHKVYKECKEAQKWFEEKNKAEIKEMQETMKIKQEEMAKQQEELNRLKDELRQIYESKRWKLINKIFKKKRNNIK